MVVRLVSKYFLILLGSVLFFSFCKKKDGPEIIIEKVQPTFMLGFFTQLDFVKTPTGFDTTLSLYTSFSRHFDKPKKSDSYLLNVTASCNSTPAATIIASPNNISPYTSFAHWHASATEIGDIDLIDATPVPTFTNPNWWSADSINTAQNFVIDFSSFKDYGEIIVDYGSYYGYNVQINYPANQATIPAHSLDYLGPRTINIWVVKNVDSQNGNKTINFNKSLHFQIHTKTY